MVYIIVQYCGIQVYISIDALTNYIEKCFELNDYEYIEDVFNDSLNLTCSEVIIKRLLE